MFVSFQGGRRCKTRVGGGGARRADVRERGLTSGLHRTWLGTRSAAGHAGEVRSRRHRRQRGERGERGPDAAAPPAARPSVPSAIGGGTPPAAPAQRTHGHCAHRPRPAVVPTVPPASAARAHPLSHRRRRDGSGRGSCGGGVGITSSPTTGAAVRGERRGGDTSQHTAQTTPAQGVRRVPPPGYTHTLTGHPASSPFPVPPASYASRLCHRWRGSAPMSLYSTDRAPRGERPSLAVGLPPPRSTGAAPAPSLCSNRPTLPRKGGNGTPPTGA